MKQISKVFTKFKQWKAVVEKQIGKQVKYLRTDTVMKSKDKEFIKYCKDDGITRHFITLGGSQ